MSIKLNYALLISVLPSNASPSLHITKKNRNYSQIFSDFSAATAAFPELTSATENSKLS